ncbi:MAG: NAD(P)H-dependent glycerol-3-phosphate dehydrogenase, partial [bacterium]
NRTVGISLGKGKQLNEVIEEMSMVAEGIKTTKAVHDLSKKLNIEMPIMEQVYKIIYKNKQCSLAVRDLLKRELKVE